MELLEEDLTCPICCCLFDDPRVLSCSHSFCKKCLEGILEGNRGPAWRPPFKCPTCRKETAHNGANSLQINYSLRGIVEKYNKIKVLPRMSLCKRHDGQPLNIFCSTDLKLICGFCATTGEHKGHTFCALEDGYEQEKAAFEELFEGEESWKNADILSCLETLETGKKKALQLVSKDSERVADYFRDLTSALEHKKDEILSDFETLKLAVMQAYDPEINRLRTALEEQQRALSIADSFRNISDPLCFLQRMQEFREKLRLIRETPLPTRTDMDVGPVVHNFDVRLWDSLRLGEVDQISVPHDSGSYCGASSRLGGAMRGFVVFLALLLPGVLLLQYGGFVSLRTSACSQGEALLAVVSSHLTDAGRYWHDGVSVCAGLMDTCQSCVLALIDTTVHYIGSCKFS
ncbi:tripartite motif-containing 13 isoform X2 [Lampris incognitus]|nr:tripartite motif-containing 13 isoform X2 [Lampris incognitus]XP_056145727.1 tripartite motif-containing 13 isoform X2 [Lampris incognitus]